MATNSQYDSMVDTFLNDGSDVSNKPTTKSKAVHSMTALDQRMLVQEFAEVSGASLEVFRHMKEIEVLLHRLIVFAPTYVQSNPRVGSVIQDWNAFRDRQWDNMKMLSVQDNPLGA